MAKERRSPGLVGENRKAWFNYEVAERLECGIQLSGTEIKSVRARRISFANSYAQVERGELWLRNLHIAVYDFGNINNHLPERARRLLAHRKEILHLARSVNEKGYTLIPMRVYFKGALCKIELGLCRGKKLYDKRETIKKRDLDRDAQRQHRLN